LPVMRRIRGVVAQKLRNPIATRAEMDEKITAEKVKAR